MKVSVSQRKTVSPAGTWRSRPDIWAVCMGCAHYSGGPYVGGSLAAHTFCAGDEPFSDTRDAQVTRQVWPASTSSLRNCPASDRTSLSPHALQSPRHNSWRSSLPLFIVPHLVFKQRALHFFRKCCFLPKHCRKCWLAACRVTNLRNSAAPSPLIATPAWRRCFTFVISLQPSASAVLVSDTNTLISLQPKERFATRTLK